MLINAPRGVERHTTLPHKGRDRDLRKAGLGPLAPSHKITLSANRGHIGESIGPGARKAFHFCRSHVRPLPQGGVTRVRGYWRGDPSLGLQKNDYVVRGAPRR
jgi:hypothetical protein